MPAFLDISGKRFGRVTALTRVPSFNRRVEWFCECDCGAFFVTRGHALNSGHTRSCGCYMRESAGQRISDRNFKHGKAESVVWRAWRNMHVRCSWSRYNEFEYYGGRGISVCDRWRRFENFYADMGDPPAGHTLDRINNDGNYEPKNCRWATPKQQANNRRKRRWWKRPVAAASQ